MQRATLRSGALACYSSRVLFVILVVLLLWQPQTASADTVGWSGSLETTDPFFQSPDVGDPPTLVIDDTYYYDVQPFYVDAAGSYILSMIPDAATSLCTEATTCNGFFVLYQTSFDPAHPLVNALVAVGDGFTPPVITRTLTAGVQYYLVTTHYYAHMAPMGGYNDQITGPGIVTLGALLPPDLTINDVTQNEGNGGGTTTFTFTVSLSTPAPAGGVTFDIATQDVSATAGSDYTENILTGQTIPAGASSYTFDVLVTADSAADEDNETFHVNITNVTGANATDAQGIGTIISDEVAILVYPGGWGYLTEAAGADHAVTFTLSLGSQPAGGAPVDIPVSVSSGECTISAPSVTIPNVDWHTGATVTVTAVDDDIDDDTLPCNFVTGDPTSGDPAYDALMAANSPDVLIDIIDDDTAWIDVDPEGNGNLTEAAGPDHAVTLRYTLTSQPAGGASVDIPVSVSSGECTISAPSVTIANGDWRTGATVTVTAVDDLIMDGDLPCDLTTGDPTSGDPTYDAFGAAVTPDTPIIVIDNDVESIYVNPAGPVSLNEAGAQSQIFTFRLASRPAGEADVDIPVSVSSTECTLTGGPTVNIPNEDWASGATVTVTAVNDAVDDGDLPCNLVTGDPTSGDAVYNALDAAASPDVDITIVDDDLPLPNLSINDVTLAEGDTGTVTFSFTVSLSTPAPAGGVTFDIATQNVTATAGSDYVANTLTGQTIPAGSSTYTFDVLVNGDYFDEGASELFRVNVTNVTGAVVTDGQGTGTITDDDTTAILVNPTGPLSLTETGAQSQIFTFTLNSVPLGGANVSFDVSVSSTECTLTGGPTVTIANADWNIGAQVTVTAVNDAVDDGDLPCNLVTGDPTSGDPLYAAAVTPDVDITITDDDSIGINVTPAGPLSLTETGPQLQVFTFTLDSRPVGGADVSFGVSVSDPSQCTLSGGTVTILNDPWPSSVQVTVTATNDAVDDGDLPCNLVTGDPTSGDAAYDALTAGDSPDVDITIIDDDGVGINVSPTGPLSLTETGPQSQVFTFTLDSQPAGGADVSFDVSVSDPSQCTLSGGTVTIPNDPWPSSVQVTVTAVDDVLADGDLPCNLVTDDPTSGDAAYDALDAAASPDVNITIVDNDTPGFTVNPTTLPDLNESGGTQTFTVRLNSQPTADVTIGIVSSDTTECTASPASLTFDGTTWVAEQTVTVTAQDDTEVDGPQPCTIQTSADTTTTDAAYNGLDPADVTTTVQDNDTAGVTVTPTLLNLTEGGAAGSYTIALGMPPSTGSVTVQVAFDAAQVRVNGSAASPVTLTFSNTAPQTVPVVAVNNAVVDGARTTNITHTISASDAPEYQGLDVASVQVRIADDDQAEPEPEDESDVINWPEPPPAIPMCTEFNFRENAVIRAGVPEKYNYAVYCRVLVENRQYLYWYGIQITNSGEVGIRALIDRGVLQAVDVFSPVGMTTFDEGAMICLKGAGDVYFLSGSQSPRVPQLMSTYNVNPYYPGFLCTNVYEPGTLVMVDAAPATPTLTPVPTVLEPTSTMGCEVFTIYKMNLRAQPDIQSDILATVPFDLWLPAFAREGEWFQVYYENKLGWLNLEFLNLKGTCE